MGAHFPIAVFLPTFQLYPALDSEHPQVLVSAEREQDLR